MRARCLCGDVVWEVEAPLHFVHHCHCQRCQKAHGTGFSTMGGVAESLLRWVRGVEGVRRYAASTQGRPFCGRCGSPMPGAPWNGIVFVPLGPLEGDFESKCDGHIFVASKAPWLEIRDGLPAFDAFPPGVDTPVLEDLERGTGGDAAAGERIAGSCLCGGISWEIEGAPELMRHCHCLRCRRARSAAHATNALVSTGRLHWKSGRERVALFKLPEAARFSQAFCPDCGGKVPWQIPGRDFYNVPAGSFDDDPGLRPLEHIFVSSKAHWHPISDELPRFPEAPPSPLPARR